MWWTYLSDQWQHESRDVFTRDKIQSKWFEQGNRCIIICRVTDACHMSQCVCRVSRDGCVVVSHVTMRMSRDGCVVVSHVTMRMSRDGCGGWFLSCEWFFIRMNKGLNFSQLMCFNNVKGLKWCACHTHEGVLLSTSLTAPTPCRTTDAGRPNGKPRLIMRAISQPWINDWISLICNEWNWLLILKSISDINSVHDL
jgi:hypothetical protein